MKQNHHFIVPKANFKLLQGMQHLSTYTFNSHQAKHTFCKVCGVQSFYTPRSNPDGYGKKKLNLLWSYTIRLFFPGIMPHCIFGDVMDKTNIQHFDGQHWEQEIVEKSFVKNLSKE